MVARTRSIAFTASIYAFAHKTGSSKGAFWKVVAAKGGLTRGQLLRCRIRYLTEGAVIGSRAYVEDWFAGVRDSFGRRDTGARPMRGGEFGGLCSLRDLREPLG